VHGRQYESSASVGLTQACPNDTNQCSVTGITFCQRYDIMMLYWTHNQSVYIFFVRYDNMNPQSIYASNGTAETPKSLFRDSDLKLTEYTVGMQQF